jgi:hypothetical protein
MHFAKAVPSLRVAAELPWQPSCRTAELSFFFTPDKMQTVATFFIFTLSAATADLTHFTLTYEQSLTSGVTYMEEGTFFYSAHSDYK